MLLRDGASSLTTSLKSVLGGWKVDSAKRRRKFVDDGSSLTTSLKGLLWKVDSVKR
jgi:hypothetical protein